MMVEHEIGVFFFLSYYKNKHNIVWEGNPISRSHAQIFFFDFMTLKLHTLFQDHVPVHVVHAVVGRILGNALLVPPEKFVHHARRLRAPHEQKGACQKGRVGPGTRGLQIVVGVRLGSLVPPQT